jgi:sec-independent protein translocase protein TatC
MKLRPIGHEDRLSIIDHLDELRTRLIICGVVLFVAFGVCFWQNNLLLNALNRALPAAAKTGLGSQPRVNADISKTFKSLSLDASELSGYLAQSKGIAPGAVTVTQKLSRDLLAAGKQIPRLASQQEKPITIGVGESFTTTMLVAAYFALLITLPLLLYQVYAFVIPALSKNERKVALPAMIAAPVLFLAGAVFTYFAILPPAVHFLQGYNSDKFQVLVQAKSYYSFEIVLMLGIGLAFQVPLLALGLQKVGAISASTLTLNWRYITVLIAVIVAALPGVDPVTMTMETLPLAGLYIASIVMLKWVEYRNHRRALAEAARATKAGDSGTS